MASDLPALRRLIHINTAGRVLCSCRRRGIGEPARIAIYVAAVEEAVLRCLRDHGNAGGAIERVLDAQIELLEASFQAAAQAPADRDEARAMVEIASAGILESEVPPTGKVAAPLPEAACEEIPPARGLRGSGGAVDPKTMEEKLHEARKPLQKLLREDCVHLGLVASDRAEALVRSLAGRTREQAEADIVAELRNNLHQQLRSYMRKHRGGPWPTPRAQEELRLDIVATRTVHSLLTLARQIMRERESWESTRHKGVMRSLLGGKLRVGTERSD